MKNSNNIEISALRVFAAVGEADSLTQAAERIGITQSAVSQTIKQLESQTGTQLVLTRSRPIKLTPSGQVLKGYADNLINDTKRMLLDVREASSEGNLPLNIGMIDSFCDVAGVQFMQQVKPFTSKLALRTGLVSPLTQDLLNRDLDLLITSDPIGEHPELQRFPLLRDPIVMIVPDEYANHKEVSPSWLAENLPFVRYNRQSRLGSLSDLIARRLNIELDAAYELDSTQTLLRFVQSGQGWALTSGLCLVRYPELLKGSQVMPLTNGANARHLTLVCRNNELGDWPTKIASICRSIYTNDIVAQMKKIAPWLEQQAYSITEMPAI
ncbi:LysR family transcriptional regulator [Porticoccaceae bacterium]|jgi:DNA-binding transcriptional LysR family regulator|nr:LysR family transcriptional regulator [Porticoccaceae bacterium]MDB3884959.1 LysR family transcriptional regulator [Porticoccaceae bacterium]